MHFWQAITEQANTRELELSAIRSILEVDLLLREARSHPSRFEYDEANI
jgi:hypothetical protein